MQSCRYSETKIIHLIWSKDKNLASINGGIYVRKLCHPIANRESLENHKIWEKDESNCNCTL